MNSPVLTKDPLKVLSSTKRVVELAQSVRIVDDSLNILAGEIRSKIESGLGTSVNHFGAELPFHDMVQLVFWEDVLNFCTWAEKGKERWRVSYPKGTAPSSGWYGKTKAFKRALDHHIPILDMNFLKQITEQDLREILKGIDDVELPLIPERAKLLREAGEFLQQYEGHFINVIEESQFDAIKLTQILINGLTGFQDKTVYKDAEVYFYKRAQICASDVSVVVEEHTGKSLSSREDLTAFADNALPHFMRQKGVLLYNKELAGAVDAYVLLESGSEVEVEIRSATIWVVELIRQLLEKYSTPEIDYAMWQLATSLPKNESTTHHRTYTINY